MGRDLGQQIPELRHMFQSTRPHGARQAGIIGAEENKSFNPRARMGRDTGQQVNNCEYCGFNPRARMGRDLLHSLRSISSAGFNPRARMGRDFGSQYKYVCVRCFNPRARMGRDYERLNIEALVTGFNPRARMGRDADRITKLLNEKVSIHAPAWGATKRLRSIIILPKFQSTRPHGARR